MDKKTYTITVQNNEKCFNNQADQHLLEGVEKSKSKTVTVGCRGGGCGVCKIRVLAGEFNCMVMSRDHISMEEEAEGIVLACRAYPESDLTIEPAEPAFLKMLKKKQRITE